MPARPKAKPDPKPSERKLQVEHLPIDALTPDPQNARDHGILQIRQLARSIETFGFNSPILIDGDHKILAGHGRWLACKSLGHELIPVIRVDHLTPEQARAFAIADNRLVELSTWNDATLAVHLKDLAAADLTFDLEVIGFSMGEIDLRIEGLDDGAAKAGDPDDEPPAPGPAVCRPGDLWTLGPHRILCGDALEAATYGQLMGEDLAAAVFMDPPYNVRIDGHVTGKGKNRHREFAMATGEMSSVEFTLFLAKALERAAAASQDGSVHFVCIDWRHAFEVLAAGDRVYDDLLNICVWAKNNGGMRSLYRSAHELVAVFRHGRTQHRNNVQLGRFGRSRTNVWSYPGANSFVRSSEEGDLLAQHPTPKPVALVADALLDVTARGDVVLDNFLGSGSTLIAAERIGRRARGVELDPAYVDLAIRRWQRLTGEVAVRADGAKFNDLADEATVSPEAAQ